MKAIKKYITGITAGLLIISASSFGQTDAVTGFVYDDNWEPIIGVNVILEGTALGSITNMDGRYIISGITDPYCNQTLTLGVSVTGYFGTSVDYYEHCDGGTQTVNIWLNMSNDPLVVTNTDNSGTGSLRQAIIDANSDTDKEYIHFSIPGTGVHTIQPASALPAITNSLVINGFTQPGASQNTNPAGTGFNTILQIEIDGSGFVNAGIGLSINSDDCEIYGLIINRFSVHGVMIVGDNNIINECFIGTDPEGSTTLGYGNTTSGISIIDSQNNTIKGNLISGDQALDSNSGIAISSGASLNLIVGNLIGTSASGLEPFLINRSGITILGADNIIGGTEPEDRNLIYNGINFSGESATGNKIMGNYIGPDVTGQVALDGEEPGIFSGGGIKLQNGASGNEIGPDNVISGNANDGIRISGTNTGNNRIFGNLIGVTADGNSILSNNLSNVVIEYASNNRIGGLTADSANVISGALSNDGVVIMHSASRNNIVGNLIGTDQGGDIVIGNAGRGVYIHNGATENVIGPDNLISGNGTVGIYIDSEIGNNRIIANKIGTDLSGTSPLANIGSGIVIDNSQENTIGGTTVEERNIIYGGVQLFGIQTAGNKIQGNYVGPDITGQAALGAGGGIILYGGASDNEIGPDNVISGNDDNGIRITDHNTSNNRIFGNYIGEAASGFTSMTNTLTNILIENAPNNRIGGLTPDSANVISRSMDHGVQLSGQNATGNHILGNRIGTNASGAINRPNRVHGVMVWNGASGNVIGPGNLISGNLNGVYIYGTSTTGNSVIGNFLGTVANGMDTILNRSSDIRINDSPGNIIGGAEPGLRNVFSSIDIINQGAENNTISGNYIGITASGDTPLIDRLQYPGILIQNASDNTIGPGNVIGGKFRGIMLHPFTGEPEGTSGNRIIGNLIGTNADGSAAIQNTYGIEIYAGENYIIGGIAESDRNIISGNRTAGIILNDGATQNQILGNYFGTDITGKLAVPNINQGIVVLDGATENFIGTGINGIGNLFAFNIGTAIALRGENNYVLGNVIHENAAGVRIGSEYNTIGGMDIAERNIFWGNDILAILVESDGNHNLIEGNILGTDAEGREDKTDAEIGISLLGSDNVVKNNLISGFSENALQIIQPTAESPVTQRNRIEENAIGLSLGRENFIPNGNGISIRSSTDNLILRNEISGNTGNGIVITDPSSVNNQLSQNNIYNNGLLGIDLNDDGVTDNDLTPPDIDIGPNNLQNFPELESVSFAEGNVTLTGSLSTGSSSTYIIEFFASGVGDNTGYGEGEFFLGEITVPTNEIGNAQFETTLDTKGYGAQVITATATDLVGNTSEFSHAIGGMESQVFANMPFEYTLNSEGLSTVPLADYQNAIRSSFQTWEDIPTAEIQMFDAGSSDEKYAKARDGLNLISFQDDRFPFAKGVLAVTAKTLQLSADGTVAEILDADIIFNPGYIHDPVRPFAVLEEGDTDTEAFDIQSVTTHEIGHVLGMIHSGVYSSTMFFMLGYGTTERELDGDDMAWASFRYPGEDFQSNHGLISGRVTYGDIGDVADPSSHPPVAGALVLAVNTDSPEMIHAYTDADGYYTVPIPMQEFETDEYWIYIQPLDGDVYGTSLKPANISPYIYSHTIFTDFPEEFYDDQESADDIPRIGDPVITVTAGGEVTGIDLITNRDLTPPTVIGTSLDEESEDVAVSPTVAIKFSEPVDIYSFNETTCYFENSGVIVGGEYTLLADSTHIVLMKPVEALQYNSTYTLHIDGITDLKDNALAMAYTSSFTTLLPDTDPPEVYDVIPANEEIQVDVTKPIKVFFSEAMNKSSVETGFTLMTASNILVAGDFAWDLTNKEMTYLPEYSLEEGTDYVISLSTLVTDLSSNAMAEEAAFTFSTVDVAIPQILYLGPDDGDTEITVETPVVVKFSEPMDLTSFTASSFSLAGTTGQINGTYEYLDDNRTIVFRPDLSLNFDQFYTITLTGDISDISDPKQYLQNTIAIFRTAPEVVVPHILYMEPAFGAVDAQTTIVGSGFDPVPLNNIVTFNGSPATVSNATLESLTVNVPNAAYDGPVTISVNGVAADNSFEFDVVPPNTDPSYSLIASSTTGSKTRAVVINPDAGYAYVTNWGDNTVTPIDISGYIPVPEADIPVGIEPMDIALNPDGTLAYVTNYLSNTVSVIGTNQADAATYHLVTKDIPVGYHPYGIAASSDKLVYVANNESEYVSVIDVDPSSGGFDHVIANVTTGSKNRSIVVTPDAALILVTGEDGVNIIDRNPISPTFNDVIASASKGSSTRHITITPDAALALATTDDGVILIIDIFQPRGTEFGNVIASVKTGSSARNINISPDAMYVYITNPDENTVSVYQLDYSIIPGYGASLNNPLGLVHVTTIEVDDTPYAIVGHPNSEYILVTHDSEEGGVSKIGIEEESMDPIHSLGELIASVGNAIEDDNLASKYGKKLLKDLNKTLSRINSGQLNSALDHLDNFIERVERYMSRGEIPEALGNAWLHAAYRIREQLLKDLEAQQSLLKGSGVTGSNIRTMDASQKAISSISNRMREDVLKLENRPNPFSYHTQVYFEIPDKGETNIPVIMRVFNTSGQVMKTLVHMDMEPGRYSVIWNSNLDDGGMVPGGIYLLELMTPGQRKAITISVIK